MSDEIRTLITDLPAFMERAIEANDLTYQGYSSLHDSMTDLLRRIIEVLETLPGFTHEVSKLKERQAIMAKDWELENDFLLTTGDELRTLLHISQIAKATL